MENSTYITLSRQMVMNREMEITANNLANATTPGFQRSRLMFVDYLTKSDRMERAFDEDIAFVQDIAQARVTEEGQFVPTGNSLDFAIQGEGYFVIDTPLGERYTRNGQFTIGVDGDLVTSQGLKVMDANGNPIPLPATYEDIDVVGDGTILATQISAEGSVPIQVAIGQIGIVTFENQQDLREAGNTLLRPDVGVDPIPAEEAQIVQGFVENSNVNPIAEITRMIGTTRAYGSAHSLVESEHERMRRAYQVLSRQSGG